MEVILLERIGKLGQMGDVVRVKDGYARNFLLPRGKALRATADNKSRFEGMKGELFGVAGHEILCRNDLICVDVPSEPPNPSADDFFHFFDR